MRGDILALGAVGALAVAGLARRGAGNEDPDLWRELWLSLSRPAREGPSADWAEEVIAFGPLSHAPDRRYELFLFREDSDQFTLIWRLFGHEISLLGTKGLKKSEEVDDDAYRFKNVKHFSVHDMGDVQETAAWLNENVPKLLKGAIPRGFE